MNRAIRPLEFLIVALARWLNQDRRKVVEYLLAENRVLRSHLGRRIRLTDDERRGLAVKGEALDRKILKEVTSFVTPETIMDGRRKLIAKKWDYSSKKGPGRPRVMVGISEFVIRMALENPRWGYTRIRGALANLAFAVSRATIANILKECGIEPAPERGERTP